MSLQTIINYDVSGNFTFSNPLLSEIVGAVARLKDLTLNGLFSANYSVDEDANWSGGSGVGTLNGGASVGGGVVNLRGGSGKYLDYVPAGNVPPGNLGTVRDRIVPQYNGNPANDQRFIDIGDGLATGANRILIMHQTDGQVLIQLRNAAGVVIFTSLLGVWAPVSGTRYELEFNFDITTGASRFFINGVQFGATIVTTGTRSAASLAVIRIGEHHFAPTGTDSNFDFDDLSIWNVVKHTANYTVGSADEEVPAVSPGYSTNNPNLLLNSPISMDELDAYAENKTVAGADQIKYTLCLDGVDKYWDGAAWSNSDGTYAQANLASEIETNKATFPVSSGGDVKVRAFLHSDTGTTLPTLTSVTLDYDFFVSDPAPIPECIVYTFLKDQEGDPIENAKFRCINKSQFFHSDHNIGKFEVEALTNDLGYAELSLIETASVLEDFDFEMVYTDPLTGNKITDKFPEVIVPNSTSKNLDDIA